MIASSKHFTNEEELSAPENSCGLRVSHVFVGRLVFVEIDLLTSRSDCKTFVGMYRTCTVDFSTTKAWQTRIRILSRLYFEETLALICSLITTLSTREKVYCESERFQIDTA